MELNQKEKKGRSERWQFNLFVRIALHYKKTKNRSKNNKRNQRRK